MKTQSDSEPEPPGRPVARSRTRKNPVSIAPVSPGSLSLETYRPGSSPDAAPAVSERSRSFREMFFPGTSADDWNNWRWQLRNRISTLADVERIFLLSSKERKAIDRIGGRLPLGITPYYASLMERGNDRDPLRITMVPTSSELLRTRGEADDPLGEEDHTVVPGLVHRYPDRVLFLVTNFCATYCRYCTRARVVGHTGEFHASREQFQQGIDYIAAHPEVRDVLLSGGDPLTMGDDRLSWILERLRAIPHVEFIRIGTKVPVVLPQRITRELTDMLRRYHPLWMSIHFMHPDELTPEVFEACARIADAGIPMGSQTVLTLGVNDSVATMSALMKRLLMARVRPYYIYQCDPISGSAHLRTSVEKGLEIVQGMRGFITGYAVPTFVIDAPGGGGKVPLQPDTVVGRDGDDVLIRNYEGAVYRYPDPVKKRRKRT